MAARHPKHSPDQRKWFELAEYPGLQPEDLAPDLRGDSRMTPGLEMLRSSRSFCGWPPGFARWSPWPVEIVPEGTPDPSAERRRQWSADILEAWSRGKIELGGRTGLLGPIRPIASRSTQIERASVEPRSGTLTIAICLNKRQIGRA